MSLLTTRSDPQEKQFTVANRTIAGRYWQSEGADNKSTPFIALHGWLDNANSFQPLMTHLPDSTVLALDLAGHGRSDHRSADSAYNLWQDVGEVLDVADQMGWQQFSLLGHSRGAMISVLLAAVAPERIEKLVLIDGLVPTPVAESDAPQQLAKAIADKHSYGSHRRRRYTSLEKATEVRTRGMFPLTSESAGLLAQRGVGHDEAGYYWLADPRLQGASEVKFSDAQLRAFLQQVTAPVLLMLGKENIETKQKLFASYWRELSNCQLCELDGGHHLHMDGAQQQIARLMQDAMLFGGSMQ